MQQKEFFATTKIDNAVNEIASVINDAGLAPEQVAAFHEFAFQLSRKDVITANTASSCTPSYLGAADRKGDL